MGTFHTFFSIPILKSSNFSISYPLSHKEIIKLTSCAILFKWEGLKDFMYKLDNSIAKTDFVDWTQNFHLASWKCCLCCCCCCCCFCCCCCGCCCWWWWCWFLACCWFRFFCCWWCDCCSTFLSWLRGIKSWSISFTYSINIVLYSILGITQLETRKNDEKWK